MNNILKKLYNLNLMYICKNHAPEENQTDPDFYYTLDFEEHINEFTRQDNVEISVKVNGKPIIISNNGIKKPSIIDKIKKVLKIKSKQQSHSVLYNYIYRDFSNYLSKGMTIYGEIVGYYEGSQQFIQKGYDYKCQPGTWKFMPYRIITTNEDGSKKEWNLGEVWRWTNKLIQLDSTLAPKLLPIKILYRGKLGELYKDISPNVSWRSDFLKRMRYGGGFYIEHAEPLCDNLVPREGIVIRIKDDKIPRAWKLKSYSYCAWKENNPN